MHRGGAGFSWFVVELDTAAHQGDDWFEVELDTRGPVAAFVPVVDAQPGLLEIQYEADDLVTAAALVSGSHRLSLVVWGNRLEGTVPGDWPNGPAIVELVDEVLNVAAYVGVVTFLGGAVDEPPPPPLPVPLPPVFAGGPPVRLESVYTRLRGDVVQARLVGEVSHARLSGTVVPRHVPVEILHSVTASVQGAREPALLLIQQVREDDEILALLAVIS